MNPVKAPVKRFRHVKERIAPLVAGERRAIAAIVVSSVAAGLAEAGVLALIATVAAGLSDGASTPVFEIGPLSVEASTSLLLGVAAALAVVRLLLQIVLARVPVRLSAKVQARLRSELAAAYLDAEWAEKAKQKEGHLQELMGQQAAHAGNGVLMVTAGLAAALEFLALVVSASLLSPTVAAVIIGSALLLFAALRPLSRRVRRRAKATSAASVIQASGVAESVRMAEEIEVFGATEAERAKLDQAISILRERTIATRSLSRTVPVVYQSAVTLMVISGMAVFLAVGPARIAVLGAVVLMLVRASSYGQQIQVTYQGVGETLPYLDRVTGAIGGLRASRRRRGLRRVDSIVPLTFEEVTFAYRPGHPVLSNISFAVDRGEAIGVVGPSGAGKSTLLQLLLRLRVGSTGRYLAAGIAASEVSDEVWHRRVAFLPQEPHLLNDTVAQNIRFFREWIDDAAVERAARLAHIHEDIASWSSGYETVVGQRADAVSGGQRQRLCLARALAGEPELLLLDEPTSSLDIRSERLIQQSLADLHGDLTLILVAHRLTTLSVCDRVMVIREGRIESFEQTGDLYDVSDFYRQTVDLAAARALGEP